MDAAMKRMTADKSVVIFGKSTCCMSHTIKTLICSFGANPTIYELDEMPNGQQLERALVGALGAAELRRQHSSLSHGPGRGSLCTGSFEGPTCDGGPRSDD
ncbi:hypothetical protein DH2020_024958 [Rehmannia glutinosa]|uniref:Glutaredoxin domain-containing protein n=1 Tax=Rehmannia glutinosa TaxID=99300 RepID=A0ABR0W1Y5_REHGL